MEDKKKIVVVTGANGFIGKNLCEVFLRNGWDVRAVVRNDTSTVVPGTERFSGYDLSKHNDWLPVIEGVELVVHCAGIAHRFKSGSTAEEDCYRRNNEGSYKMAEAAIKAGLGRFIFLSSAAVYGANTEKLPLAEESTCKPEGMYGKSKLDAEMELACLFDGKQSELVILRPPLVYGILCPGNFSRLVKLVRRGVPLPFGMMNGTKTYLSVDNLTDLVLKIANFKSNAEGKYNVADNEKLDLPEVLDNIALGLEIQPRVFKFPPTLLRLLLKCVGKASEFSKLNTEVILNSELVQNHFGWTPSITTAGGMKCAAGSFKINITEPRSTNETPL